MSAYDDDAGSIRHEWDEDPDEEEIVADAQRRAARGARSSSGVDALRAEVRRLRSLPVVATCGDCGWCDSANDGAGGYMCHNESAHPPKGQDTYVGWADSAPPSWCPMRGAAR